MECMEKVRQPLARPAVLRMAWLGFSTWLMNTGAMPLVFLPEYFSISAQSAGFGLPRNLLEADLPNTSGSRYSSAQAIRRVGFSMNTWAERAFEASQKIFSGIWRSAVGFVP